MSTKPCPKCGKTMQVTKEDTGMVHEVWGSKSAAWRATNLPSYLFTQPCDAFQAVNPVTGQMETYGPFGKGAGADLIPKVKIDELLAKGIIEVGWSYTHKKSSLRIWLNSARNLFMGGGGDAVGSINPMWVELKEILKTDLGITDWHSYEKFIQSKKSLPPRLLDWTKRALVFSASDYGTETRENAKILVWYRRDLLKDKDIDYGVHHPPVMTEREKIESEVRKFYFLILHRHPDRKGLDAYVADILDKKIPLEKLPELLKNSKEYRDKFGGVVPENKEDMHEQIGVDAIVHLTETNVLSALMRSNLFRQLLKPRMDLGMWVESQTEARDLYPKFYELREKGGLTLEKLVEVLKD